MHQVTSKMAPYQVFFSVLLTWITVNLLISLPNFVFWRDTELHVGRGVDGSITDHITQRRTDAVESD